MKPPHKPEVSLRLGDEEQQPLDEQPRGHEVAFLAEQYRLHAASVFRRCLVMGAGNRAWAEDVMQDVFIKLLERSAQLDKTESLRPWLHTVAYRLAVDRLRRERGFLRRAGQMWSELWADGKTRAGLETAPGAASSADVARLRAAIASLPARQGAAIVMKYFDGCKQITIAETLGCSTGYVSKLLTRGLSRLRAAGFEVDDD